MQSLNEIGTPDFDRIKQGIYKADYFVCASFEIIAKHFLSGFLEGQIFRMPFDEIRTKFLSVAWNPEKVPPSETDFYRFVCKEYLDINKLPSQSFFAYFDNAVKDIQSIDGTIEEYTNKIAQIEKKEGRDKDESDIYQIRLLRYYVELNNAAREEIIKFLTGSINDFVLFDSISTPHFSSLFYAGIPYSFRWIPARFKVDFFSDLSNKLLELEITKHREIRSQYEKGDKTGFYNEAKAYITSKGIVSEIRSPVQTNHRLYQRKKVFEEALKAYEEGSKYLFCSVIPLQIEGLFYDYALELGIDEESIKSVSLSTKLQLIIKRNPQYSNFEYYTFRFPLIRNKVAHGKLLEEDVDGLADYLLLDLYDMVKLLTSTSLPVNKAIAIIQLAHQDIKDVKRLVRYSLYRQVEIPAFYNLEDKITDIRQEIILEPFWVYLKQLAEGESEVLKAGVLKIVTELMKAGINLPWCKFLLKKLKGVNTNHFDEEEFLRLLSYE